ncbi:hypothetical protein K7432_009034 [Basidiobolus ranarum]
MISKLEYYKQIHNDNESFPKLPILTGSYSLFHKFVGDNIGSTNGKEWKLRRAIVKSLFRKSWEPIMFSSVIHDLFTLIDSMDSKTDLFEIMSLVSLDSLGSLIYGFDFQAIRNPKGEYVSAYLAAIEAASDNLYMFVPILDFFPIGSRARGHKAVEHLRGLLSNLAIDKSKEIQNAKDTQNPDDLLTVLVEAWLDKQLTMDEIVNELITFNMAGHDTNSSLLCCTIYLLAKHSDVQTKVREEIRVAFQSHTSMMELPSIAELKSLEYLEAVIKETLRLYPPVPIVPTRITAYDTNIGHIPVPKGTLVSLNYFAMHRSDQYWDEPAKFNPSRWLAPNKPDPALLAWGPFGGGKRICIGQSFSMTEVTVVLCMLVRRYNLKLPEDSPHKNNILFRRNLILLPTDLHVNMELIV